MSVLGAIGRERREEGRRTLNALILLELLWDVHRDLPPMVRLELHKHSRLWAGGGREC